MSFENENLGNEGMGGAGDVNAQPNSTGTEGNSAASGGTEGASSGGQQPKLYEVIVNGVKKQVPESDLISNYQKGLSADQKFNEAAKIRKDAEPFVKAIQNFNSILSKKDYKAAVKVLGQDFVDGLVSEMGTKVNSGNTGRANYAPEDIAVAKKLGLTPEEYIEVKNEALGLDNPIINQLRQEVEMLKKKMAGKGEIDVDQQIETKVAQTEIQNKFLSIANKYPRINPYEVLDIVEKGNYGPETFEKIFQHLTNKQNADIDKLIEERTAEKKKNANKIVSGSNSEGDFNFDSFTGKSSKEKKEMLLKMGF